MSIEFVATYRPPWRDAAGRSRCGTDEDSTTMAVAAASGVVELLAGPDEVKRVVLITRSPALVEGPTEAVISAALGLAPDVPVEIRLGGGPAVIECLVAATPGTLVVGVDTGSSAGAAAAYSSHRGPALLGFGRANGRVPARVRSLGEKVRVYDDPRLLRELGWRQALTHVGAVELSDLVIVGPPPKIAASMGGSLEIAAAVGTDGASAPLLALAELSDRQRDATIVALEADTAAGMTVTSASALVVLRDEPAPHDLIGDPEVTSLDSELPGSGPAYLRAFDAKVGFAAGRCACGTLEFPPRYLCLTCERRDDFALERLPRSGTVYTCVTIHAPVPNRQTPYSLAVVDIDDVGIRHLTPVTGVPAGSATIGDRGRFVLRRQADREVGPDYGWSFMPNSDGRAA